MDEILKMYYELDTVQQVFWACATFSSVIFIVQFLLTLIGMDHSDIDVDFDGHDTMDLGNGINLFTMKNLINFLMGFGWAGICLKDNIENTVLLVLASVCVGMLFVAMFVYIYKQTRRLDVNGAFNINDSLGRTAQVYLRIPAGGEGKGKVQISLNGSVQEFDAITDEDSIASGTTVRIIEVMSGKILKVENIQNNLVV